MCILRADASHAIVETVQMEPDQPPPPRGSPRSVIRVRLGSKLPPPERSGAPCAASRPLGDLQQPRNATGALLKQETALLFWWNCQWNPCGMSAENFTGALKLCRAVKFVRSRVAVAIPPWWLGCVNARLSQPSPTIALRSRNRRIWFYASQMRRMRIAKRTSESQMRPWTKQWRRPAAWQRDSTA
jgi:hypothetical protein